MFSRKIFITVLSLILLANSFVFASENLFDMGDKQTPQTDVLVLETENIDHLSSIYNKWDHAFDIVTDGSYAYVATIHTGLRIMDISTPTAPVEVGYYLTGGFAYGVDVVFGYAYVAVGFDGMKIIDVSDPENPVEVGHYETDENVKSVSVSGSNAYLADHFNGMTVVDISDPTDPTFVTSYYPGSYGYASDIVVVGSYAYLANTSDGLRIIDITNPAFPTSVGHYNNWNDAYRLNIDGDYAYIAYGDGGMYIVDISDPENPTVEDSWDTYVFVTHVTPYGDYAYVAGNEDGLWILDISDPSNVSVEGSTVTGDEAECAMVMGGTVFLAGGDAGLECYSSGASPTLVGQYNPDGAVLGVVSFGNYVYMVDGDAGFKILYTYENETFVENASCDIDGRAVDVDVNDDGDYAYVADFEFGLRVIGIPSVAAPSVVGNLSTDAALGVAVEGDYVYLADGNSGLRVINIVNPVAPLEVGVYNTAGYSRDVVVSGNYAYVADSHNGVVVVDISTPASPIEVGAYNTIGSAFGVDVAGQYLYVADYNAGLRVFDISDPTEPQYLGYYLAPDDDYHYDSDPVAQRVLVEGDFAYVAYGIAGLRIVDISTPSSPVEAGYYYSDGVAYDVCLMGDEIILAENYFLTSLTYTNWPGPYEFNLISPVDGSTLEGIEETFTWEATTDPEPGDEVRYYLEISTDETFPDTTTGIHGPIDDTTYTIDFFVNNTDFWWRVRAQDTNSEGTYSNQSWAFHTQQTQQGDPPSHFNLLLPEPDTSIGADGNFEVEASWEESLDPDPGDTVTYDLILEFWLPTGIDTTVRFQSGESTNLIFNLPDSMGWDYWEDIVEIQWYVEAKSAPDTVESIERWSMFLETHSSVEGGLSGIPTEYEIRSLYPNPFNPTLSVVIGLPETADLSLKVFNLMGQEVAQLVNGNVTGGYHTYTFDGRELSSGVYFLRASVPGQMNEFRKVILMK